MNVTVEDIARIVAVQLGKRQVAASARFVEDLGAESVDIVNLVAAVEERYGVTIDESEVPEVETVEALSALVRSRLDG